MKSGLQRFLLAGSALLVVNSAYLASDGDPHIFYSFNLVLHMALGIALVLPFLFWWLEIQGRLAAKLGGTLVLLSAICGVLLMVLGKPTPMRPLLWSHIALAASGLLILATQARRFHSPCIAFA